MTKLTMFETIGGMRDLAFISVVLSKNIAVEIAIVFSMALKKVNYQIYSAVLHHYIIYKAICQVFSRK